MASDEVQPLTPAENTETSMDLDKPVPNNENGEQWAARKSTPEQLPATDAEENSELLQSIGTNPNESIIMNTTQQETKPSEEDKSKQMMMTSFESNDGVNPISQGTAPAEGNKLDVQDNTKITGPRKESAADQGWAMGPGAPRTSDLPAKKQNSCCILA